MHDKYSSCIIEIFTYRHTQIRQSQTNRDFWKLARRTACLAAYTPFKYCTKYNILLYECDKYAN